MASFVNNTVFTALVGGTGPFGVFAAAPGYQSPAGRTTDGKIYRYRAQSADLLQWEIGTATASAGGTVFSRTVTSSSTGGSAVNFTSPPNVMLTFFAADFLQFDDAMSLTIAQTAQARANISAAGLGVVNSFTDTTEATGAGTTYAARFEGGVEFAKKVFIAGAVAITDTTEATGAGTTYAARFAGGVEFAKKVFIAGAVAIGAMTLANAQSALLITATQPTTPVASQNAVMFNITGAGSAAQANNAFNVTYLAGYTGSSISRAAQIVNSNAGTGSVLIGAAGANAPIGNIGLGGNANSTTTGLNVGLSGISNSGDTNVGVAGIAQAAKNSAKNIGVVGSAINTGTSPVQIGGWFSLNQTTVPTVSAALIADNGAQTDPIFRARDNGTDVFVIADGGAVTASSTLGVGLNIVAGGGIRSVSATLGIGYDVGSGGTVTQATSKSTGVTLNKVSGAITMNAASLAATTTVSFQVTNSAFVIGDTVHVQMASGNASIAAYQVWSETGGVASGSFWINVRNMTAGALAEAVVIKFNIIKGSNS